MTNDPTAPQAPQPTPPPERPRRIWPWILVAVVVVVGFMLWVVISVITAIAPAMYGVV